MTFAWTSAYTNQTVTRSNFRTDLRTRIDEDTVDFISNIQLNTLIEDGLRDISRRTGLYKEYATQAITGASSYSLPTDLTKLDYVIYLDSSSNEKQLIKSNPDEIQSLYSSSVVDYYIRYGNILILKDNPTTGTIKIIGTHLPTMPVDDNSYIDLPFQYIEILYAWCEWKYWLRRRVPEEAKLAMDIYYLMAEEIRNDIDDEYNLGVTMHGKYS